MGAEAYSFQNSVLSINGTPSSGDQLVFHFLTDQSASGSGGTQNDDVVSGWQLFLSGGDGYGDGSAVAVQLGYADGTQGLLGLDGAQQTATGFDMTLFLEHGGAFNYVFNPSAYSIIYTDQPAGTVLSASISAYLQGIDAINSQGDLLASASFDAEGLGTIDLTTTPEPASMALLGTGLIGLFGAARRKSKAHWLG